MAEPSSIGDPPASPTSPIAPEPEPEPPPLPDGCPPVGAALLHPNAVAIIAAHNPSRTIFFIVVFMTRRICSRRAALEPREKYGTAPID